MKVGFDISQIAHNGGVGTYTKNLAQGLFGQKGLELVFFYSSLRKPYKGNLKGVKTLRLPPTLLEVLFNKMRNVPIDNFIGEVDVFHSSDWVQPPSRAKKVTTYHDVVPLKYPEWSLKRIIDVHKRRLKIVEKEIDMVIAVSETTKRDLLEVSNIPPNKVIVIYEAAADYFKPQKEEEVENLRRKLGLPSEFILAIGGIGERRNLRVVKKVSEGYNLVISGETLPWLADEDLPKLYSAAKLLLYPSLYEGFGLPILEAFATGVPVITSNVSSMPEIAGDAAVLVDPRDEEDIKKKLKMVYFDNSLRKQLIKRGLAQAKKFSWKKAAKETAEVYRKLMDEE